MTSVNFIFEVIRMFTKRIASALLAGALMVSCAIPAFAADPSKDVTGSYRAGTQGGKPVYSFGYNFGSMEFTYQDASEGGKAWNPKTHAYDGADQEATEAGWVCATGANDITVVNHSNAPIRVNLTFEAALDGFKGGFTDNGFTIETAEGTTVEEAPKKTVQFGPTNSNTAVLTAGQTGVKLGTITISAGAV